MSRPYSKTDSPRFQIRKIWPAVVASVKGIRWAYAAIAFCLSVTLWYTVTVRDKVETWVDVNVQFKDAPENLTISEGLINKLAVRVRVARGLSRSLSGREASMVVDLSSISRGSNAIAVTREMLPFTSAYEVMEVSPSRIQITADNKATRELALQSVFDGKLAPDLFVKSVAIEPQKVEISGAEALVSTISLGRIPILLAPDMPKGKVSITVAVPMPVNVTVKPPQVKVDIEIGVRTKQMKLVRNVTPGGYDDGRTPHITPQQVTIVADVPETLAKEKDGLAGITAHVTLSPDVTMVPKKLPVSVTLPENAELVSVTPDTVSVAFPTGK